MFADDDHNSMTVPLILTLLTFLAYLPADSGQAGESRIECSAMSLRLRGNLARALYTRMQQDEQYAQQDPNAVNMIRVVCSFVLRCDKESMFRLPLIES